MLDVIHMIEPWAAALGIVFWELFAGWCCWTSIRCDRIESGQPTSRGETGPVHRNRTGSDGVFRSRSMHVPSTSA